MKKSLATKVQIRGYDPYRKSDINAITDIYAHHVLTGTASFEIDPPDTREMSRRFKTLLEGRFPILVAADKTKGSVIGYAYCGPFRTRLAYERTVEDSVYVHKDVLGKGVGRALMQELIEQAKMRGYLQILAVIGDSKNKASIELHRSLGFVEIGIAKQIGFKFDRLIDVVIMQLNISGETDTK